MASLSVLMVHGGPTNQLKAAAAKAKSTGPLTEALLGSPQKTAASQEPQHTSMQHEDDLNARRAKMINYYGYYPGYFGAPPPPPPPQAAAFMAPYSQFNDFYQYPYATIAPVYSYNGLLGPAGGEPDDSYESDETQSTANDVDSNENDYEEDIFSRANRRRPGKGNGNRNSPIFYIRLPPTPYMFIRGLGYISNPPTIQPLPSPVPSFNFNPNPYQNPYMAPNPYMQQPQPSNPFINVPVNYMSNAKPVGVYQYQTGYQQNQAAPGPPGPAMRFPINGYGPNQVTPIRQRPYGASGSSGVGVGVGPNSAYSNPDSKITHLKGPFIFNGRPEDIYLLQNLQTTPYNANFYHGYY